MAPTSAPCSWPVSSPGSPTAPLSGRALAAAHLGGPDRRGQATLLMASFLANAGRALAPLLGKRRMAVDFIVTAVLVAARSPLSPGWFPYPAPALDVVRNELTAVPRRPVAAVSVGTSFRGMFACTPILRRSSCVGVLGNSCAVSWSSRRRHDSGTLLGLTCPTARPTHPRYAGDRCRGPGLFSLPPRGGSSLIRSGAPPRASPGALTQCFS